MAAAKFSSTIRCSTVYPLAYRMFSRVSSGSIWQRSAILAMRSGRKVPSVSMQMTFPLPPPFSLGSCVVTHRVWANCVLPVLNSPKASVMAMVSMPPPSSSSSTDDPVVILTIFLRFQASSFPEMKPWFSNFLEASSILSILASLMPLMLQSYFLVAMTMLEMVQKPLDLSLAMSAALMPCSCSFQISMKLVCSTSTSSSSFSLSTSFSFFLSLDLSFCFMPLNYKQSSKSYCQSNYFLYVAGKREEPACAYYQSVQGQEQDAPQGRIQLQITQGLLQKRPTAHTPDSSIPEEHRYA